MVEAAPKLGRIVFYTVTKSNAADINRRRADARDKMPWHQALRSGAQVHVGNEVAEGDVYPMVITRVWYEIGDTPRAAVNGQLMLDGNDLYWVTSVNEGKGHGKFSWLCQS